MKKIISILLIVLVSNNIFLENINFKKTVILQSNGNVIDQGIKYLNEVLEILHGIEKKIVEYTLKKNDEIIKTFKEKALLYFNNTISKKSSSEYKSDIKNYISQIIKEIKNNIEKYPKMFEEEKTKYINHIKEIKFSNSTIQKNYIELINSFSENIDDLLQNINRDINDFLHFDEDERIDETIKNIESKRYEKHELKELMIENLIYLNSKKAEIRRNIIHSFAYIKSKIEENKLEYGVFQQDLEEYERKWDLEEKYEFITFLSNMEPSKIIEIFKYTIETIKNIFKRKEINEFINLFKTVINIPKEYINNEFINVLEDFIKEILKGEYFINFDFEKIYNKMNEILNWGINYFKTIKSKNDFYKEFEKYLPDIRENLLTLNCHQYINYIENDAKKGISILFEYLQLIYYSDYYSIGKFIKNDI